MNKQTLRGPCGFFLILDPSEIILDDPGAGTPAMLYGPRNISGTYWCAVDAGECDGVELPAAVMRWLDSDAVCDAVAALGVAA